MIYCIQITEMEKNMSTASELASINKYDLWYESRMTKVEVVCESLTEDVKEIKRDLRLLLGLNFTAFATLLGVMAHGFKWL